jgi:hypothetical protein
VPLSEEAFVEARGRPPVEIGQGLRDVRTGAAHVTDRGAVTLDRELATRDALASTIASLIVASSPPPTL